MTPRRILFLSLALYSLLASASGVSPGDEAAPQAPRSSTTIEPGGGSAPRPTTTTEFESGSTYRSEDGWTIETGEDWELGPSPMKGVITWYTAPARHQFRANVGVIVQPGQGTDLDRYLDLSERSLDTATGGGEVLESKVITTDDGTEIGVMAYRADFGVGQLRFYAVAVPMGDDMVLATFTARDDDYDQVVGDTEDLVRSLRTS